MMMLLAEGSLESEGLGLGEGIRGPDGHDSRAEFDADGYVVVGGEATFAEADREGGFSCSAIANADEFGDVVP